MILENWIILLKESKGLHGNINHIQHNTTNVRVYTSIPGFFANILQIRKTALLNSAMCNQFLQNYSNESNCCDYASEYEV
jgi:hypothetical protein